MESSHFRDRFPTFFLYYPAACSKHLAKVRQLYTGHCARPDVSWSIMDILGLGTAYDPENVRCKTVLLETKYIDRDRSIAYLTFYARQFREVSRRSVRFHFFSEKLEPEVFTKPSEEKQRELDEKYLGFSVVHDLEIGDPYVVLKEHELANRVCPSFVGRTVLTPNTDIFDAPFIMGCGEYSVNIAGYALRAKGFPFVEQDGRVAACASCSLWMAAASLSCRFEQISPPSPAEITRLATLSMLPEQQSFLEAGLNPEEMKTALSRIGYDPYLVWANEMSSRYEVISIIGRYLASHIPVILLIELRQPSAGAMHTVLVIGFKHHKDIEYNLEALEIANDTKYYSSSSLIASFIIHDDCNGPYRHAYLQDSFNYSTKENHIEIVIEHPEKQGEPLLIGRICSLLVPLPRKVYLTGRQAEKKVIRLLRLLEEESLWKPVPSLAFHSYIVETNMFKERLAWDRDGAPKLSEDLVALYRGKGMYRLAWVVELIPLPELLAKGIGNARSCGEFLLDTTSTIDDYCFMAAHVPGYFVQMFANSTNVFESIAKPILIDDNQHRLLWFLHQIGQGRG